MNELVKSDYRPLTKNDVIAQKRLIQEVMEAVMKEGTHYGTIPGCKQPSLYKPGSECILSTFRIGVQVEVEDLSGLDFFRYRVKVRGVLPTGEIVGEGIGECSTDEEKYRWRAAVCPEEFDATAEDRRRIIWKKADKYHKDNFQVKQVRTNPSDLANTALKMGKKRGQIDLTLTATGASDVFAQDLEDLPEEILDGLVQENGQQKQGKPTVSSPQSKTTASQQQSSTNNGDLITAGQAKMIFAKCKNKGVTLEAFCAHYKIKDLKDLPFANMNPALKLIDSGGIAEIAKTAQAEEPVGAQEEEKRTEICSNCGETINEDNSGHLEGCSNEVF